MNMINICWNVCQLGCLSIIHFWNRRRRHCHLSTFLWRQLAVQCLRWLGQSCWAIRLLGLIEVVAAATSDVAAASVRLTFCLCWHLNVNYFISLLRLEKHKQTHFDLNDMIGTALRPIGQPHAENMVTQLVSSVQRLFLIRRYVSSGREIYRNLNLLSDLSGL